MAYLAWGRKRDKEPVLLGVFEDVIEALMGVAVDHGKYDTIEVEHWQGRRCLRWCMVGKKDQAAGLRWAGVEDDEAPKRTTRLNDEEVAYVMSSSASSASLARELGVSRQSLARLRRRRGDMSNGTIMEP